MNDNNMVNKEITNETLPANNGGAISNEALPANSSGAIFSNNNTDAETIHVNTTNNGSASSPQIPSNTQAQNIITAKDATKSLIVNWLIWYIIFSVAYAIINVFVFPMIESQIIQVIASIALQALMVFGAWFMSTKFTFKNKAIRHDDIHVVMKNLIIFSVIVCAVNAVYQFVQLNSTFDHAVESDYGLRVKEKMAEQFYGSQGMQEYYQQKSEAVAEAKRQSYIYLAVFELFSVAIFLAILPIEKKLISKHATMNDSAPMPSGVMTPPTMI